MRQIAGKNDKMCVWDLCPGASKEPSAVWQNFCKRSKQLWRSEPNEDTHARSDRWVWLLSVDDWACGRKERMVQFEEHDCCGCTLRCVGGRERFSQFDEHGCCRCSVGCMVGTERIGQFDEHGGCRWIGGAEERLKKMVWSWSFQERQRRSTKREDNA